MGYARMGGRQGIYRRWRVGCGSLCMVTRQSLLPLAQNPVRTAGPSACPMRPGQGAPSTFLRNNPRFPSHDYSHCHSQGRHARHRHRLRHRQAHDGTPRLRLPPPFQHRARDIPFGSASGACSLRCVCFDFFPITITSTGQPQLSAQLHNGPNRLKPDRG